MYMQGNFLFGCMFWQIPALAGLQVFALTRYLWQSEGAVLVPCWQVPPAAILCGVTRPSMILQING